MPQARRSAEGGVALVCDGGEGVGRDVALALGARGVAVVVAGPDEWALGRVVGEVTCGGGKARHMAGKAGSCGLVAAAIEKAHEAFGEPTLFVMVATEATDTSQLTAVLGVDNPADRLVHLAAPTRGATDARDLALFLARSGPAARRVLIA